MENAMSELTMNESPTNRNPHALTRTVEFEGRTVTAVYFRDRWVWPAAQVGEAIGYEHGRKLADNVRREWPDEFVEGKDYEVLRGADLKAFRDVDTDSVFTSPKAPHLLVLTESGIDLALVLAKTEKGRRLRRLLVDHILPQLRATGTAALPGAPNLTVTQLRELAMGAAAEAVNPILERLAVVFDRMRVVEQAQVPRADTIFCGATEGARMRAGMRRVAHLRTIYLRPPTSLPEDEWKVRNVVWRRQWRRELGEIQREVQDATHHEGLGKSWDFLPIRDLTVAWETIRRLEAAAERDREKRAREAAGTDSQTVIEFDPKKKREK
jgi:prophage antirepressor-like protein